jgi:hypothetical protein
MWKKKKKRRNRRKGLEAPRPLGPPINHQWLEGAPRNRLGIPSIPASHLQAVA